MTHDTFLRQLEAISAEYRRDLPDKLARIESMWNELAGGRTDATQLADVVRELHTIAGSAKTFGIAGVSEAAAAAESFLDRISQRRGSPDAAQQAEFARLLGALKRAAGLDTP